MSENVDVPGVREEESVTYEDTEEVVDIAEGEEEHNVEEEEVEIEYEDEEEIEEEPTPAPEKKGKRESFGGTTKQGKSAPTTPVKRAPGKVKPSEEVKKMKMRSPLTSSETKGPALSLSPEKNPFPSFGQWTPETLSEIEIVFPTLTSKNETTNELTRATRPEARYWKAPVVFKYGNFTSETLRFNNVHIPFHTGKGYGTKFVYISLPNFAADAFSDAGKKRAPTTVGENSLVNEKNRWWKIANNIEGVFGIINQNTKKFHPKSLATIFDSTSSGVSCSVVLSFMCKASTTGLEALRPTTVRTLSVVVVRAYIDEVDINVQLPTKARKNKPRAEPTATRADVASDDLMKRLSEMGI